jgi:hypothetical protein
VLLPIRVNPLDLSALLQNTGGKQAVSSDRANVAHWRACC